MLMDCVGPTLSVPPFILLILFGVFFVLQLLLAVLEDNFSRATELANPLQEAEEKVAKIQRINALKNRSESKDLPRRHRGRQYSPSQDREGSPVEACRAMDKEMHIDSFSSITKFVATYVQRSWCGSCLIMGQVQHRQEAMMGSDFLFQLSNYQAKNPKPRNCTREAIHLTS